MNINKRHIALGAALIIGNSASAQNLIINGDFETGISGTGYTGAGYNNEIGSFRAEDPNNPNFTFTNNSDWVIFNEATVPVSGRVGFADHLSVPAGLGNWGLILGNYTQSTATYDVPLNLAAGTYVFSADHWGDFPTGSQFQATLFNLGGGDSINIGSFTDSTDGSIQKSEMSFDLGTAGSYNLVLAAASENTNNAWVDNISLTAVPEPSSTAFLIGLSGMGFAYYFRRRKVNG